MAQILVVDDDQIILDMARAWLEEAGHTITEAMDGRAAHSQLSQAGFDLLVTDLAMPHVDGIELIQDVRNMYPALKIMAMSGKDQTGTGLLRAAKTLGADSAIPKPLEQRIFVEAVDALLK